MTFLKVAVCLVFGYLLYEKVDGSTFIITYAMMVFLFVMTNSANIRALVAILAIHIFILYESLYATYYLTRFGLETGKLIGDMSHNMMAILSYILLLYAIYYREEVTRFFYRGKSFMYMPTKADIVQIFITKVLLTYQVIYTIVLGYFAVQHTITVDNDPVAGEYWWNLFSDHVWHYREYSGSLGSIKLLSFSLLMLGWSSQSSGTNRPTYQGVF